MSSRPMRASWMSFGSSRNMSSPGAQRVKWDTGARGRSAMFQKKQEQRFAHVCTMLPTWGWFIVIDVYPETGVLIWLTHYIYPIILCFFSHMSIPIYFPWNLCSLFIKLHDIKNIGRYKSHTHTRTHTYIYNIYIYISIST